MNIFQDKIEGMLFKIKSLRKNIDESRKLIRKKIVGLNHMSNREIYFSVFVPYIKTSIGNA
jgi:hypothetical protein